MYIKSVQIENIKCFWAGKSEVNLSLQRPDGSFAGFTVLAGRNGSGKSTFLRAIALAVAGVRVDHFFQETFRGWITEGRKECLTEIELAFGEHDKFDFSGLSKPIKTDFSGVKVGLNWKVAEERGAVKCQAMDFLDVIAEYAAGMGPWAERPEGWFMVGYGPFRNFPPHGSQPMVSRNMPRRITQLASLFREEVTLSDAISWLKEVYLRRLEGRPGALELEQGVITLLNDGLLPEGLEVKKIDSDGLWVSIRGRELPLKELGDGYRTVTSLVVDIARQLFETYGEFKVLEKGGHSQVLYSGVVLIDEIDAHLHVSWQQQIGFWLKSRFPRLQFIVTTHSPFICQAADPGGLIYLPAEGEERQIATVSVQLYKKVTSGRIEESVLSELFGLVK